MIENLLNMLRQRQTRPRYEGRHRAEAPQPSREQSAGSAVTVN
jgi:hypothetical protein